MLLLSLAGFFLTGVMVMYSHRARRNADFLISSILAGLFFFTQIQPYILSSDHLFVFISYIVVFVGAAVGGILGMLLPKLSRGLTIGTLISVFFGVLCYSTSSYYGSVIEFVTFAVSMAISFYITQYHDEFSSLLRISSATGLLFAVSVDNMYSGSLLSIVSYVLRMSSSYHSVCYHECHVPLLVVLWLVMSVVTFYTQASITGQIAKWQNSNLFQYKPVEQPRSNSKEKLAMQQKVTLYPDSLETNYFNIDSVPEMLQAYAEIVFQTVQQLSTSYGFQVDSSRNQAEHLLMMLTNEQKASDTLLTSPVERLHFRLFKNYKKWCARMVSEPLFTPNIGKKYACQIEDMLMYLLIWGEAANLRHMPECLCFLYHKTMTQHMLIRGRKINTSVYAGYFLDCVITPIYDVIAGASKQSGDHNEKKTYDDFNEFFWSPLCLQYNCFDDVNNTAVDESGTVMQNSIDTSPVAYAMKIAPKTYIEKRSWLHPLFSMHRIFEWHVITFSLLVTWAFSVTLVWSWAFTYQIASFIFWEITLMNILWTCLEVWSLFPHATISGPSIYGYLLRIIAGYLVLIYQTIYFSWSFRSDLAEPGSMRALGDSNFWWWQYVWISLLASSLYLIQSIMCWFPSITSSVMTSKSEIVQAIIQICYPMSQLYVGKVLHVSQMEVFVYIFYWLTLIAFKLWFGYRYIVFPVTVPSLELFDDYMNYEEVKFVRTAVLMFAWWFPHFMVYIIDLSIWYSVWSSMVGGFVALYERQGAVRNTDQIRANFMKLPLALCSIMIPATNSAHSSSALLGHSISTASMTSISRTNADEVVAASSTTAATTMKKAVSQSDLRSYQDAVVIQSLQQPDNDMLLQTKASNVFHKLDIRAERWIIFSRVWNEIIIKLRATDHISNAEMTNLMFDRYDFLSKPVYLPLYQTAGLVDSAIFTILDSYQEYNSESDAVKKFIIWDRLKTSLSHDTLEACNETWELALWVTKLLLGKTHAPDINLLAERFDAWSERDELVKMLNLAQLPDIMKHLSAIVALLNSSLAKRKRSPVVTPANIQKLNESSSSTAKASAPVAANGGTGLKKSISMGFLGDLKSNDPANDDAGKKYRKPQPFRNDFELVDLLRDALRDNFKALLQKLQLALKMSPLSKESDELIRALNMVMVSSVGWFCNDLYASTNLDEFARDTNAAKIVNKLNGLLRLRHSQVELDSPEATRRLNFFVNSLFMDIPVIPTSRFCKEYTTMTPFYEEDVILTRNDLEEKNSDGISTILYLKTLYKRDWNNFLERRGFSEDQNMWSKEHLQETRIWASLRAQTLYRTVEGMMYSEAALRLLCELEHLPVEDIDNIVKLKFQYVVTCQRYGHHRKEGHHKADDIDFLLARHHHLRVAYIETRKKPGDDFFSFFSVLIKHDPNAVGPVTTKEVYKIQLPGNPILGEGKPENQNHAIIFSRGRYLQAIDMNQDGYFEEFLKMRNLLQEFEHGTTIIGFREHIFTGSVSSVANYMALQELSFVTLGQRVLAKPLRIRQHYGHPDLFDKMFVMTEGGMSKASKGINLSEDVFAGFNATIRGHSVDYKEYLQVGKGRDVGLQQTYKFEAKLSQGNAEQSLSRDMNRLCDRLDFFRLMSFFYGGIGHYMANTMVMFTLVLVVYTMLNLAIYGEEGVNGRPMHPEGVLQLLLSGLGLLQTLPLMVTLTVEKGFLYMLSDIAYMILSGGPLYFIFHIQTKCYYFQHTLLAGGAIYRASGRGFVIKHTTFDDNYRFFASSHIYLGFELMVALVLFALYTTSKQYGGLTWSLWLTTVSFLIGPFWFNPITFEWNKLKEDYVLWSNWMAESGGSADQSWEIWWKEENNFHAKLSLSWKMFLALQKSCLWLFLASGLFGSRFFRSQDEQKRVGYIFLLILAYAFSNWMLAKLERTLSYAVRRFTKLVVSTSIFGTMIYLICTHTLYIKYAFATYYLLSAVSFLLLLKGVPGIIHVYKMHDYLVGHTIFFLLGVMSLVQIGYLQTWLLYHNALSSGVVIDDLLKYTRKSKEKAVDEENVINELRTQVMKQEKIIQQLLVGDASNKIREYEMAENVGLLSGGVKRYGATSATTDSIFSVNDALSSHAIDSALKTVSKTPKSSISSSSSATTSGSKDIKVAAAPLSVDTKMSAGVGVPYVDIKPAQVQTTMAVPVPVKPSNSVASSVKSNISKELSSKETSKTNSFDDSVNSGASSLSTTPTSDFIFSQPTVMPPRK